MRFFGVRYIPLLGIPGSVSPIELSCCVDPVQIDWINVALVQNRAEIDCVVSMMSIFTNNKVVKTVFVWLHKVVG
jgi:hypothetical protein